MAEIRGRRCDRNGCDTVVENVTSTPDGWIRVTPVVRGDVRDADNTKEFCSNYCLAYVALERYENESGKRLVRQSKKGKGTAAQRAGAKKAAHVRLHVKRNIFDENCEHCKVLTEPGVNNGQREEETT